jgi:hypothetical protein
MEITKRYPKKRKWSPSVSYEELSDQQEAEGVTVEEIRNLAILRQEGHQALLT